MVPTDLDPTSEFYFNISEYLDVQVASFSIETDNLAEDISAFHCKMAKTCEILRVSGQKSISIPILGPKAGHC